MSRVAIDINKKQFEQILMSCGRYFSADQVADCLDVSRTTLYRWIKKEYPKENFETLKHRFNSKSLFQLNAYRWKAMSKGNARLIERSMEEEGLWEKRDGRKAETDTTAQEAAVRARALIIEKAKAEANADPE